MNRYIQQVLEVRGIPLGEQEHFLHPDFERDTHDPFLLKGMKKAVARLSLAIKQEEPIYIFGDYDADGVPATALLVRALTALGGRPIPIIPTRASGYGLTPEVVDRLIAEQCHLLVTVDNGTVSKGEIADLAKAGVEVIVCDHHEPQPGQVADQALAILNPKQTDCTYPFKELCGCALAWKLANALYQELGTDPKTLRWELDLVAFSTIADMVPLVGENRVLAVYGLKVFRKSHKIGLRALAEAAGVDLKSVKAGDIGYRLAPRINAPSRMHQEMQEGEHVALQLLVTDDPVEAGRLATYLSEQNSLRQGLLEDHIREAEELMVDRTGDRCVVVYKEGWSTGVIGLVAGRLLERYRRPIVVLAREERELKGSVRSVDGVHAVQLIESAGELLLRYGGHGKAAGLTFGSVDAEGIGEFRQKLNSWLEGKGWELGKLAKAAQRSVDLELPLSQITLTLADELEELEPFGVGFPAPLFKTTCTIRFPRKVGASAQHLSFVMETGGERRKAIAFGQGDTPILDGEECVVFFTLQSEEWDGQRRVSCRVQRIEKSEG